MAQWSGGYGDSPDVAEVIAQEQSWLRSTSCGIARPGDPDLDDIAQEGRIAIWRAIERYDPAKGPLDLWVRANARWRMKTVRSVGTWTGKPDDSRATLGGYAPRVTGIVPVGFLADMLADAPRTEAFLAAAELLESAEMSYHHGQIAQALTELPPRMREYVWLRFWRDASPAALRDYFGYEPSSGMWRAPNAAKARLRSTLAHLSHV